MRNTARVFRSDTVRARAIARPEQNSLKKSQSIQSTETSPILPPRGTKVRGVVSQRQRKVAQGQKGESGGEALPMVNCKMVQLCALGDDALNSIRRALRTENGGRVALEVLTAMGIALPTESGTRRGSALGPGLLECPMSKLSAAEVRRQFRKAEDAPVGGKPREGACLRSAMDGTD